jgi:hypothetical protein
MDKTTHIIISSKNRNESEKQSFIRVNLPTALNVETDEYFTIKILSFNMIKAFYAVQEDFNDEFHIIIRNPSTNDIIGEPLIKKILPGNYNALTLMDMLNALCKDYIAVEYDKKINKYFFDGLDPDNNVCLKPINCGLLVGFEDGIEQVFNDEIGVYSDKFINVSGYTTMMLKISGNIDIQNTFSNIKNKSIVNDKILGILSLTDVQPMSIIEFNNKMSDDFTFEIKNNQIDYFNIEITNENGNHFPQLADYILTLQIKKIKKNKDVFSDMLVLLNQISYYLLKMMQYLNIFPE